jgi:hypothetical protein
MALHIEIPIQIKIREGIRVNVGLAVSHAVEKGAKQSQLKKEVSEKLKSGDMKPGDVTEKDYELGEPVDTISFWFVGGTSLSYRVGKEIEQSDFDRIDKQLQSLEFRSKDDRKPSDDKTTKPA